VRVAALSDIHGNLPALEAVLAEIEGEDFDAIVVAGDTVAGPWPVEVFDAVVRLDAVIVGGNADRAVLEREEGFGPGHAWCADRLDAARLESMGAGPLTNGSDIGGLGHVLVCHSKPESDMPIYTRITPDTEVVDLFAEVAADVVVCGHTHMQYDRLLSTGLRIVNPGSIGMPYEGAPGAYWAVLGPDVEMRRTEYDTAAAAEAIGALGAPAEQQVEMLLEPPDPVETTEYFESLRGS